MEVMAVDCILLSKYSLEQAIALWQVFTYGQMSSDRSFMVDPLSYFLFQPVP